jgi:hypothetical protein
MREHGGDHGDEPEGLSLPEPGMWEIEATIPRGAIAIPLCGRSARGTPPRRLLSGMIVETDSPPQTVEIQCLIEFDPADGRFVDPKEDPVLEGRETALARFVALVRLEGGKLHALYGAELKPLE